MSRPFIHVNCAMSADGKIAGPERKQVRISSDEDIARVKQLRRDYDGILVGVGTVIADDPHLTVKGLEYDQNPVRFVLDRHGRIPAEARVLDDRAPTVIITDWDCDRSWEGRRVIRAGNLTEAMEAAGDLGVRKLIVEGGGEIIAAFFRERLVDRYTVFVGSQIIGGRTSATPADGDGRVAPDGLKLRFEGADVLGNGVLLSYTPEY